MNASTWRKAADRIAQGTQATQQIQAAATADSSQLESFSLSSLAANDSGPPQVNYGTEQPLTASTPRATQVSAEEIQSTDTYCQIIPSMSEQLYPTLAADGLLSTPAVDDYSTLHRQITSELDQYLINNLQQHQYSMSPDSEYITLILYATKLEINLCNFLAIWVVLSILLDTKSNDLQYVQNLQQVVDDYYNKHTTEAMTQLEQQASKILDVMYDSVTNSVTKHNFDSISDDVDRVSDAVDNDSDKIDTDSIKLPYDNDNNITTGSPKYERNMTDILKDTDTKDKVPQDRDNNTMTKVKWSTETNNTDNQFLREHNNMCRMMEDRQITDYYQAQRHMQSAIMGDTPVKTVQNRQYIDNVSDYDSELHRISKSVHHKLDLGPISLLGAQQHTTIETAAALKIQDKTESDFKAYMQNDNVQYRTEIYNRAESMIPQLDSTHIISDSSDTDSHDYLDLASTNIIQYRTRGWKQRQKASKAEYANRHLANIEYIKPNTGLRKQRQKVPDDEDIDMDKIVKDDTPRYTIK